MTHNQKYNLFLDAVRIIRSLADVFEAIADTYRDATVVETDAKVIDAQEVKELPAEKEITLEDVRAVLGQKSQAGMTAEVRELITKYGGTRLSDIDPEQCKALFAEAEMLGNEQACFSFPFSDHIAGGTAYQVQFLNPSFRVAEVLQQTISVLWLMTIFFPKNINPVGGGITTVCQHTE